MWKSSAETNITYAYKLKASLRKMKFQSVITPFLYRRHKEIYGTNYFDNGVRSSPPLPLSLQFQPKRKIWENVIH